MSVSVFVSVSVSVPMSFQVECLTKAVQRAAVTAALRKSGIEVRTGKNRVVCVSERTSEPASVL